jgi:hypothetical protein
VRRHRRIAGRIVQLLAESLLIAAIGAARAAPCWHSGSAGSGQLPHDREQRMFVTLALDWRICVYSRARSPRV